MSSCFCFFKQKTAYEMRISDWSSDVCSSDLDIAIAGVFVSIDADGSLSVDRGFVRPEDVPHVRTDGGEGSETDTEFVGPASPSVQRAVITIGGPPVEPEEDDEDDGIKPLPERPEERRTGQECGSKCITRWAPINTKKNTKT